MQVFFILWVSLTTALVLQPFRENANAFLTIENAEELNRRAPPRPPISTANPPGKTTSSSSSSSSSSSPARPGRPTISTKSEPEPPMSSRAPPTPPGRPTITTEGTSRSPTVSTSTASSTSSKSSSTSSSSRSSSTSSSSSSSTLTSSSSSSTTRPSITSSVTPTGVTFPISSTMTTTSSSSSSSSSSSTTQSSSTSTIIISSSTTSSSSLSTSSSSSSKTSVSTTTTLTSSSSLSIIVSSSAASSTTSLINSSTTSPSMQTPSTTVVASSSGAGQSTTTPSSVSSSNTFVSFTLMTSSILSISPSTSSALSARTSSSMEVVSSSSFVLSSSTGTVSSSFASSSSVLTPSSTFVASSSAAIGSNFTTTSSSMMSSSSSIFVVSSSSIVSSLSALSTSSNISSSSTDSISPSSSLVFSSSSTISAILSSSFSSSTPTPSSSGVFSSSSAMANSSVSSAISSTIVSSSSIVLSSSSMAPSSSSVILSSSSSVVSSIVSSSSSCPTPSGMPVLASTTCSGRTYINRGVVAFGELAATSRDSFGDTIGGIGSGIAPASAFSVLADGTVTGSLFAIPDRGWNTGGTVDYQNRIHNFTISFIPKLDNCSQAFNLNMLYQNTLLLAGPTAGSVTTGLDATTFIPASNGFPDLPAAPKNGGSSVAIDSEGIVAMNDGSYWVSDEYGPYAYHFSAGGAMIGAIRPPNALIPMRSGMQSFSSGNPPVGSSATPAKDPDTGRVNNHGFEGLAIDPTNRYLSMLLQGALIQEGGSGATTEQNVRLLTYDLSATPPSLYRENVVTLPKTLNPTKNANNPRTNDASELHYLAQNQFFVLSRDSGNGNGAGSDTPSVYRQIDIIDTSAATDYSTNAAVNAATGAIATTKGVYSGKAATYCSFLNLNNNSDLYKFNVHNGPPGGFTELNEKWESIAIVKVPDGAVNAGPNEYYLITMSDNDFITANGYYGCSAGSCTAYSDPTAQKSGDVPTQVMVFQVNLPNYGQ